MGTQERVAIAPADYELDLYAWAYEQAALIRALNIPGLDAANIAEEIESLGRSDRRELRSRMVVLLAHLLKWQFQPSHRSGGWRATIFEQRRGIGVVLRESPSLRPELPAIVADEFHDGRQLASDETNLPAAVFPAVCPYALSDILDREWLPPDDPLAGIGLR